MPRSKWRTVSCTDDSLRSHTSQPAAYRWVGRQAEGAQFRVMVDNGDGWEDFARATVMPGGWVKDERAYAMGGDS
jgi:hypothetical protein